WLTRPGRFAYHSPPRGSWRRARRSNRHPTFFLLWLRRTQMRRPYLPILLALAALPIVRASAHADFVKWSYNWSRAPSEVVSADPNGTSTLALTDEPLGHATNDSDIVATNIRTFSNAPRATPIKFMDAAYALTLKLTDDASGESGTLSFNGSFSG